MGSALLGSSADRAVAPRDLLTRRRRPPVTRTFCGWLLPRHGVFHPARCVYPPGYALACHGPGGVLRPLVRGRLRSCRDRRVSRCLRSGKDFRLGLQVRTRGGGSRPPLRQGGRRSSARGDRGCRPSSRRPRGHLRYGRTCISFCRLCLGRARTSVVRPARAGDDGGLRRGRNWRARTAPRFAADGVVRTGRIVGRRASGRPLADRLRESGRRHTQFTALARQMPVLDAGFRGLPGVFGWGVRSCSRLPLSECRLSVEQFGELASRVAGTFILGSHRQCRRCDAQPGLHQRASGAEPAVEAPGRGRRLRH